MSQAISTTSFIDSLGVNTHLDFGAYGYTNVATVENAIKYLGVANLRDSAGNAGDLSLWQQVAQATGVKFDAYIGETSPGGMSSELALLPQLASEGILNYIEGGNEEDDSYPLSLGNNQWIAAQFQQQVWSMGQQLGLPVINISFGAGWTYTNNWQGNYGTVGNLAGITNYANAHTYPGTGDTQDSAIARLNGLAQLAASGSPVITTEMGWDENLGFDQGQVAKDVLSAALDGMKDGDVKTYFYALFNDGSGNFGLMNQDGSPKPAGAALHNLTTLLGDNGGSFNPGSLDYSINTGDNTLLMEKSDGSYWLSIWNESAGAHSVTLTLGSTASQITVFDPLTGTSAVQAASNTNSVTLTVPDHPVIVEIGGGSAPVTASTPTPTPAATPTPTPTPVASPGAAASAQDLSVAVPASAAASAGGTTPVSGISVNDAWAAGNTGRMALNVWDQAGTLSLGGQTFGPGGGQVPYGMFQGSLDQINADLSSMTYTAAPGGGSDTITVDVWNQAGVEVTRTISVNADGSGAAAATPTPAPAPTPSAAPAISIASDDATPVITASNTSIGASAGDHMIFIGATGDTLTATGGTESVQAYQGGNTITTGAGDDMIRYAGNNNVIDAGAGNNHLEDSGSNNTIVLPGANQGYDDIFGNLMSNGDQFDLRPLLAGTSWNGDASTLGNYISVNQPGTGATISINPTGTPGGGSVTVATLEGSDQWNLQSFLAHAIT